MRWLIAAAVLIVSIGIGSFAGARVRRFLSNPARSERHHELANPAGSFVFSMLLATGLVIALGIGSPESLDPLPGDLIAFLPKVLVAGLMLLAGTTAGQLVGNALGRTLLRATGRPQPQIVRLIRAAITGAAAILAVSQLGINTRIVDMIVAGLVFSLAGSITLLTGLGGRDVAKELAAGRYVARILSAGDHIVTQGPDGAIEGTVVRVHSVTVELKGDEGVVVHVPHGLLLRAPLSITKYAP